MPNISGSFTGNVRQMTLLALDDQPNHQLQVSAIAGTQRSPDPDWNNSSLNYWGTADLVNGSGAQRGHIQGTDHLSHHAGDELVGPVRSRRRPGSLTTQLQYRFGKYRFSRKGAREAPFLSWPVAQLWRRPSGRRSRSSRGQQLWTRATMTFLRVSVVSGGLSSGRKSLGH